MMTDMIDDDTLSLIEAEPLDVDMDQFFSTYLSMPEVTLESSSQNTDDSSDIPINPKDWMVFDQKTNRLRPPHLYEFLVLLLQRPEYSSYASWFKESPGLFEVHQPEKLADLWAHVKTRQANNPMTYDKLARAIRWYYPKEIMIKTNARYTFQFSPKFLQGLHIDENNNLTITTPTPIVK